ncbi:Transglutaminase-like superfamily protein [anaerobic digester metagenome]
MKRHLLLVVLLLFGMVLPSTSYIYATTANQEIAENITNASNITENTTDLQNTTIIQNTTAETLINETAVSDAENNQSTDNNTNSGTNSSNNSVNSNVSVANQSSEAAGDETYNNVHGIWLSTYDVSKVTADELIKDGITDVFVKTNRIEAPTYQSILKTILSKLSGTGIRVHAWITCFVDANGKWIDPQGTYTYKVNVTKKVAYKTTVKSWYKSWYKKWYKYHGKWKYTWKYTWKSKSKTVTSYKTVKTTETRTGYSTAYQNTLINFIKDVTTNYNIDGIHLDYVRYPGTAYKYSNGTQTLTNFVKRVHDTVNSIKPKVAISAALMPEGAVNGYYYGQDYKQLSQYLDFLVPMIYKGNYNENSDWIGEKVAYIVSQANGKPVLAGLQTYESDKNVTPIPGVELNGDVKSAWNNGASGYVLFRYGLIDKNFNYTQANNGKPSNNQTQVTKFTRDQIKDAASRVKTYVETNKKLPNYVQIGSVQVEMPEFLKLLTDGLLNISKGSTASVTLKSVDAPSNPTEDLKSGNINKTEYLAIASKLSAFLNANGAAPNYAASSLGKIQFESLVYMYSKILNFYGTNKYLPSYVSMNPWKNTTQDNIPASLQQYLNPTKNCQSTNAAIVALSKSITSSATSSYDKATKIFNWVRDNLGYKFYYNTQYGAVGTLNAKTGNCVDTSHLIVALSRAAGIPARYVHGSCTFSSGTVYGHVWAQIYVNGKWYNADAISLRNTFGVINNWNTSSWTLKGIYSELPF